MLCPQCVEMSLHKFSFDMLDEEVLVPCVQWLFPASVQPQIDAPVSTSHVMLFVHVMATGSDVLCNKNPVSHDVQSSALSFPQLAPAAAVPLAHVHTGALYAAAENATLSTAMSPFQLEPFVPLKRTRVAPAGRSTPAACHGSLSLACR